MRTLLKSLFAAALGVAVLAAVPDATAKRAAPPKAPEPGKALPDTTPLEATLEGTAKYALDLGGVSADDFAKSLKGEKVPAPPKVDLKLVLKNTSKETIQVWNSGDTVSVDLKLTGKGAMTAKPNLMTTADFKLPKAVEIEAGKTLELPIKALAGGPRNIGEFAYWTQAGEYELVATIKTGVNPAPKGAADGGNGFGLVQVASKAFKITVEEKK